MSSTFRWHPHLGQLWHARQYQPPRSTSHPSWRYGFDILALMVERLLALTSTIWFVSKRCTIACWCRRQHEIYSRPWGKFSFDQWACKSNIVVSLLPWIKNLAAFFLIRPFCILKRMSVSFLHVALGPPERPYVGRWSSIRRHKLHYITEFGLWKSGISLKSTALGL